MKACVLYDSQDGNVGLLAKSLSIGLNGAGVETGCIKFGQVDIDSIVECDLISVGAPTEGLAVSSSSSDSMRNLLAAFNDVDSLSGKLGFAFDTKASPGVSGGTAAYIETNLRELGLHVFPHESAIVYVAGPVGGPRLKEGETERFLGLGRDLAKFLLIEERARRR